MHKNSSSLTTTMTVSNPAESALHTNTLSTYTQVVQMTSQQKISLIRYLYRLDIIKTTLIIRESTIDTELRQNIIT